MKTSPVRSETVKKILRPALIVLAVLIVLLNSITIVQAGHTGVVVTLGKVKEGVLAEGIHFKAPFVQKVVKIDNRIQKLEVQTEAFSKDLQSVQTVLAINYRVDTAKSYSIYKNIGANYETVLVVPAVNEVLKAFGQDKIYWFSSNASLLVIVILFLWKNLGYNMILFMAALNNVPKAMLEAAEVEGASEWTQFVHIKLRYLSPTILFVTILSIINSFKVFREIYLLTGNYPYDSLYMLQHFMNNMFRQLDYQKLSAAAVLLAIVIVILIAILFAVENFFGKDVEG